jgi:hypothetical protein
MGDRIQNIIHSSNSFSGINELDHEILVGNPGLDLEHTQFILLLPKQQNWEGVERGFRHQRQ